MTRDDARSLAATIAQLAQRLAEEPRLQAELQRARRDFFGPSGLPAARSPGGRDLAEHRFAEWFLLERESETFGAVPVDVEPYATAAEDLDGTLCGLFVVDGAGQTARDLQSGERVELDVPPDQARLGDLLVGRLHPVRGERWVPSVAVAWFRPGEVIAAAFQRDLERADLGRRLQQVELEHLLLQNTPKTGPAAGARPDAHIDPEPRVDDVPLEHLEAQLETLLASAPLRRAASEDEDDEVDDDDAGDAGRGAGSLHAAAISARLADAVRPGQVIGPVLDQLAFHTSVDLDRARELLLAIWNAHHPVDDAAVADDAPPGEGFREAPGETMGERLVRLLDEGLRQHRDVGEIFAQIERVAGIDGDEDEADDGAALAGADHDDDDDREASGGFDPTAAEGDLDPLILEYAWETGREGDPGLQPLRLLVELQQNAPIPRTDLEQVTSEDLMRLLLHVYLGAAPSSRAAAVRGAFAELQRFYEWAAATQDLELAGVLGACRGALLDQVERLDAVGASLSSAVRPRNRPGILEVEEVGADGFGVRDDDGGNHWIAAPKTTLAQIRVGDLLLAALGDSAAGAKAGAVTLAGLVVALPEDARSLIE
jgi:hypothetical protein